MMNFMQGYLNINMNDIFTSTRIFALAILVLAVSGCVSEHRVQDEVNPDIVERIPAIKGAPDWVNRGSYYFAGKEGRFFYGVASSTPMGDMALQKSVSDDMARAEAERLLTSFLGELLSDSKASGRSERTREKITTIKDETLLRHVRNIANANFPGIRISGGWRDLKSNNVWSLAELDMKYVKKTLTDASDMNDDLKRHMETEADNVFDRIFRDIAKEKSRMRPVAD